MKRFILLKYLTYALSIINSWYILSMDPTKYLPRSFDQVPTEVVRHMIRFCYNDKSKNVWPRFKTIISCTSVCKKFRHTLDSQTITVLLQLFTNEHKDQLLQHIIHTLAHKTCTAIFCDINPKFYPSTREIIVKLVHTGAILKEEGYDFLVYSAMRYNDVALIQLLFDKKQINPYKQDRHNTPLFFYAQTVEMAQVWEKQNIQFDASLISYLFPNILWTAVSENDVPSSLVEYYLHKGISTRPRSFDNSCLLHQLVDSCDPHINIKNMLHKGKLLLEKEPRLINTFNNYYQTPLDCAKLCLKAKFTRNDDKTAGKKLITFLKKNGGKLAKKILRSNERPPEKCIVS